MTKHNYTQHRTKRTYDPRFKAELVSQCISGDRSIAALAFEHDMNPNVLHRWLSEYEKFGRHDIADFDDEDNQAFSQSKDVNSNWLSILPTPQSMPSAQPKRAVRLNSSIQENKPKANSQTINISVKSDSLRLDLQWPNTDQTGLAKFIKELMA